MTDATNETTAMPNVLPANPAEPPVAPRRTPRKQPATKTAVAKNVPSTAPTIGALLDKELTDCTKEELIRLVQFHREQYLLVVKDVQKRHVESIKLKSAALLTLRNLDNARDVLAALADTEA